jgi:hypothetical protein
METINDGTQTGIPIVSILKHRPPTANIVKDKPIFESAIDHSKRLDSSKISANNEVFQIPLDRVR